MHARASSESGWISLVKQTLMAVPCVNCGSLVTVLVKPSQPTNLSAVVEVATALIATRLCSPATHAIQVATGYISPLGHDVSLLTDWATCSTTPQPSRVGRYPQLDQGAHHA